MRTTGDAFRRRFLLPTLMAFSIALAACGGGGGSTSSNPAGTASVSVSLAAAPGFPASATLAAPLADPVPTAQPDPVDFTNVVVTVTGLALIPSSGPEYPNPDGEPEQQNSPSEEGMKGMPGFVTGTCNPPVPVDLYNPPPPSEKSLDLCTLDAPPGVYTKIRVYYDSVVGKSSGMEDILFHPTAHYHFDVHFVGGNLVVPGEASMPGVQAIAVVINVVGLKITQAGNSGNILMRPQVFATVDSPGGLVFRVQGEAMDVNHLTGEFLIRTSNDQAISPVSAVYTDNTQWRYVDLTFPEISWKSAGDALGPAGFDNTARVAVTGRFSPAMDLQAEQIDVELPDTREGEVLEWNPDNTAFLLKPPSDNTIHPMPDRESAYYDSYDNIDNTYTIETFEAVVDNTAVRARGYATNGDLEAFWISIVNP